jgi:hypothetical protein
MTYGIYTHHNMAEDSRMVNTGAGVICLCRLCAHRTNPHHEAAVPLRRIHIALKLHTTTLATLTPAYVSLPIAASHATNQRGAKA